MFLARKYLNRNRLLVAGTILIGILLITAIGALFANEIFSKNIPSDAPDTDNNNPLSFPGLVGTTLLAERQHVPADLAGELKLIVIAYDVDQQPDVDSWLEPLETLNERYPALHGYYVPLLPQDAADNALFIIGGMALAAGSNENRERTIVVFTDVDAFNTALDLPDKNQTRLFLLDAENEVIWQGGGPFQQDTLRELDKVLTHSLSD